VEAITGHQQVQSHPHLRFGQLRTRGLANSSIAWQPGDGWLRAAAVLGSYFCSLAATTFCSEAPLVLANCCSSFDAGSRSTLVPSPRETCDRQYLSPYRLNTSFAVLSVLLAPSDHTRLTTLFFVVLSLISITDEETRLTV